MHRGKASGFEDIKVWGTQRGLARLVRSQRPGTGPAGWLSSGFLPHYFSQSSTSSSLFFPQRNESDT